jgi:hypothetical protein
MVLNKHMMALAASALFIGGAAYAPAQAADLGGDCCADLEERVAELEATTARKGNRKVSLTVSGQVNRGLLIWDDGKDSDAYVVEDAAPDEGSKVRFSGKANMKPGWTAGFVIELGFVDASSLNVSQNNDEGPGETTFETRLANWYIESEKFGRVTVGQQNSAADGITVIDLSNSHTDPVNWHNLSFDIRTKGGDFSGIRWGDIAFGLEGFKGDFIRYDTPSIYGFIASVAWGENDTFDAALRFKKEWNSFRVAAGIGYIWVGEDHPAGLYKEETEIVSGSISLMHVPTGLFANFAAGDIELKDPAASIGPETPTEGDMWFIQAGIEKNWTGYGATTLYAEYGEYNDIFLDAFSAARNAQGYDGIASADIAGSEVTRWGFGVVQNFDAAALTMYVVYQHFEADLDLVAPAVAPLAAPAGSNKLEDWDAVIIGSRIKF